MVRTQNGICAKIIRHMQHLLKSIFCVWCGICAKYLAFSTYPTSTVGALIRKKERLWARLVMEFKNCCIKRCENCSLKSIIEKCVFNGYKTQKCVWYHDLNYMFLVFKKHKNVFGTYVRFKTKADTFDQNKLFLIKKISF